MSDRGILYVVSGPSGVGKSSISRKVIETVPDLRLSVSCTTRSPRPGEEHGREYWFVSHDEFRRMIDQQAFAEWAEVYGFLYGTPWKELNGGNDPKHDIILDIDVQGARQVMQNLDDAISVFVMPPSLDILKSRLRGRGTDRADIVERRFKQAQEEMQHYDEYDYTILNGSLDHAAKEFASIVLAERRRTKRVDPGWLQQIGLLKTDELEQPTITP